MTRFDELKRIERALETMDKSELEWALSYCQLRLKYRWGKLSEKAWAPSLRKVQAALDEIEK